MPPIFLQFITIIIEYCLDINFTLLQIFKHIVFTVKAR
ncbi:hypothetical protein STAHO0001_0756 [Staphylococcus hominis SK119]|nr:hypothetical protein STAHO0001_0756 [Staphylococcus hominis SK119]